MITLVEEMVMIPLMAVQGTIPLMQVMVMTILMVLMEQV